MTQQNNNPEDPRDPSEDYTRPLNAQEDPTRAFDAVSDSSDSESSSPDNQSSPNSGDNTSSGSVSATKDVPQGNYNSQYQQSPYGQQNSQNPYGQNPYGQQGSSNQQSPYAQAGAHGAAAGGYGAYYAGNGNNGNGGQQYPYNGGPQYGSNGSSEKPQNNIIGLIALALSVLGLITGCIPAVFILGWILLFAGFVMGIIALVQKNKTKWAGITAIIVSVLGSIISMIVVFVFAVGSLVNSTTSTASSALASATASVSSDSYTSPEATDPDPVTSSSAKADSDGFSSDTGKIGDTFVWDDGVEVTISQPKTFKPSDTAAGDEDKSLKDIQKYTVTVKNGSDKAIEANRLYISGISGGKATQRVFDSSQDITSPPSARLQPGKSVKFDIVFAMVDHKDASFDVSMGFDRDKVTFVQE